LLGAGSKPLQLFGLRKTPELSLALRQALSPLGRSGLSSSNGRLPINRPFAHSAKISGHKGRIAIVTDAGWDAVDAAASGAHWQSQGELNLVSDLRRADERR
jgi:hypothetical protein